MTAHWIQCSGLTIGVLVDPAGLIVDAPSLVEQFIGQPFGNLLSWIEKFEITDDDIDSLPVPSKHTIELTSFVKASEIDPVYFERSYYLEADDVGAKPYALLMRALKTKQVAAIAKVALRNKESL